MTQQFFQNQLQRAFPYFHKSNLNYTSCTFHQFYKMSLNSVYIGLEKVGIQTRT